MAFLETLLPPGTLMVHRSRVVASDSSNKNCTVNGKPGWCRHILTQADNQIPVRPVILLVDRSSASASELVSMAVKDYQRAVLIGEPTMGKGITQNEIDTLPLPLAGTLAVTSGYFFGPAGETSQIDGVVPHIVITDPVSEYQQTETGDLVRMKDRATKWGDRIVAKPEPLPPESTGFKKPENPSIPDNVLSQMTAEELPRDPICSKTPKSVGFKEEEDCLLTMGVLYMRKLLTLKVR
jgi:hypothetical protein